TTPDQVREHVPLDNALTTNRTQLCRKILRRTRASMRRDAEISAGMCRPAVAPGMAQPIAAPAGLAAPVARRPAGRAAARWCAGGRSSWVWEPGALPLCYPHPALLQG